MREHLQDPDEPLVGAISVALRNADVAMVSLETALSERGRPQPNLADAGADIGMHAHGGVPVSLSVERRAAALEEFDELRSCADLDPSP